MEHTQRELPHTSATWIDHAAVLPVPADGEPVGLDTEFMRRNTFYPRLALVQAAHGSDHWLLDPLAYDAGPDLRALLAGRRCVMHSASEDLEALAPLLGDQPLVLFDTQVAAALCGMGEGLSYQRMVAMLLDIDIPKDETRSDWLQRPLTAGQCDYAEQDVAHLAALHDRLSEDLRRLGRDTWHAEDCQRLVRRAQRHREAGDPQPQRGFPGAAEWAPEDRARLRRVLLWRDDCARRRDKPRPWLLDDAHALALSQDPPSTPHALFERVKGQRALRGEQRGELLAVLQAHASPAELADLAPIPALPRGETKRAAEAMRQAVKAVAAELGLAPSLLCPRRVVEQYAVTGTWPEALEGWREPLLKPALEPLLPH